MIKRIITSAVLLLPMFLFAQNEDDALRYSYFNTIGTARFSSMGGAMGAVGADFGALATNPASIGLYRRSEITLTPNLYLDNTGSNFNSTHVADSKLNFNFSNIGAVFTSVNESLENKLKGQKLSTRERKRVKGWMSSSFAIGLMRQGSFHKNFVMQGVNTQSSITDMFAANAQGYAPDQLNLYQEQLAYYTYAIDTVGQQTNYIPYVPYAGTLQRLEKNTKGSMSEVVFSYGANYNHKLYFGGTIGIPRIRYTSQSIYTEADPMDTISAVENFKFDSLRFTQNVVVKGSGINLKLGFIYRASDKVRLGIAFHTPSYLRITENYDATMKTVFKTQGPIGPIAPQQAGQFTYNQVTPLRVIASAAFVFEKKGMISLEYELVPYSMSKMTSSIYDFKTENQAIKDKYAVTGNARIGGEIRVSDRVAARAGFAYIGNPFKSSFSNGITAFNSSIGLGYRVDGFIMDFAYVLGYKKSDYYAYSSDFTRPAAVQTTTHNLLVTFGVRF